MTLKIGDIVTHIRKSKNKKYGSKLILTQVRILNIDRGIAKVATLDNKVFEAALDNLQK